MTDRYKNEAFNTPEQKLEIGDEPLMVTVDGVRYTIKNNSKYIEDLKKQNEILQAKLDEAVSLIKINLMPIFNSGCDGCREAERISREFLTKMENNHDQCLSTDECQEGKE